MILFIVPSLSLFFFFFFNDTATTEIYTLSLHDALPIGVWRFDDSDTILADPAWTPPPRSEEHMSELQSQFHLVCRLLLEKKKNTQPSRTTENNKKKKKINTNTQLN